MNVLIACEESQEVCKAFRQKGHDAFSCDIQPCSGGHPEWHILQDCIPLLNGYCEFFTQDGKKHHIFSKWDMIIAHPPCTYLTPAGEFVGLWVDSGLIYIDVSERVERLSRAIVVGIERKQKSIFDWCLSRCIGLEG